MVQSLGNMSKVKKKRVKGHEKRGQREVSRRGKGKRRVARTGYR